MRINRLLLAAAVASLVHVVAPAAAEDLTLVFKSTGHGGTGTTTSYYSSEKMRTGDAEAETIVEYGPGKIITIDHKKKQYSEMTLAEMEAAMQQAAQKMEQMQKQFEQMPPAVREKMEQMMGGGAAAVTVTKGGTREVAGYSCQDYTLAMGETMTTKLCASTALAFPAPNVDFKRFSSFATSAGMLAQNPMFKGMAKMADELKKIEGITLAESTSVKMMGRSIDSSREATEVKKGPIPASVFDLATIAKGYKKVPHPITKMK
jgi:DNA-binding protein YbaB